MSNSPAKEKSLKFQAVIDTREQRPLSLEIRPGHSLSIVRRALYTGDYSIVGLEKHVAIERKSLDDLMGCIGKGRERFEKEIDRLLAHNVRALVVESDWSQIEMGNYRSGVKPQAAIGSMMGWICRGIPIIMTGDHRRAGVFVARMLWVTANRRLGELKNLLG